MSSQLGKALVIQLFGESHGPVVGVTLEGVPAGFPLDVEAIDVFLRRRASAGPFTTARQERDRPRVLSGLRDGRATGTPLTLMFDHEDVKSNDYDFLPHKPRPGHVDYPAWVKSGGFDDLRGGGHHSGRLTLPYAAAGAVALQMLEKVGIRISARLVLAGGQGPAEEAMLGAIASAKAEGDSVGGVVEVVAQGALVGLGEPYFEGVEALAASHLFSIPGVKAVEFGAGFEAAVMKGSQYNDPYALEQGRVVTRQNHGGGLLGGLTTGMPIVARVGFRPTASIARPQQTVDLQHGKEATLTIEGRHDPCIAYRAVPVVESAMALALCELWLRRRGNSPWTEEGHD